MVVVAVEKGMTAMVGASPLEHEEYGPEDADRPH